MNIRESRENLRQLILDFIDTPMDDEDEAAWQHNLGIYDGLLAEVKQLREELRRAVDWHLDYIEGTSGSAVDFLDYVEGVVTEE